MASSLECITWMVVGLTESVTIIVLNSLTVIAFYRNRYFRKRSTYLVISLAVADMLSGVISPIDLFYNIGATCNFWRRKVEIWNQIPLVVAFWFPGCSLINMTVISLERLNATFWPFRHRSKSQSTGFLSSPSGWQHYSFHVRWEWLITMQVNGAIITTHGVHSSQFVFWSFVSLTFLFLPSFALEISLDTMAQQTGKGNWPWRCSRWLLSLS